tara:strand:+ start:236 stop:844 length:609 start_codon:yes stop_codon:yes gene_type:complete
MSRKKKTKQVIEFIDKLHFHITSNPQFRQDTSRKSEQFIQAEIRPLIISFLEIHFHNKGYIDYVHCSTNKSLQLYTLIAAIFIKLRESSGSMYKLSIQDKVNLILFIEMGKDHKHFKKLPQLLKPSGVLTLIDSIKDDEHREAKIMKKLLRNYVDKDKNKFLKNTKKFIKAHEENLAAYNSWLIFKKYLRYKEFKELRYKRS